MESKHSTLLEQFVSFHDETPLHDLSKEELIQRLEKAYAWIEGVRSNLEGLFHMEKKKTRQKKAPDLTQEEMALKEREKRIQKEKKEWDSLLPMRTRRKGPRPGELMGYWQPDQYILKPVRHYADCYPRQLLLRNLNKPKMFSSILCFYFYPNYHSTIMTRVYLDAEKPDKAWLRDDDNKWHNLSFRQVAKNMIFHAVSAYNDLLKREKSVLSDDDGSNWRQTQTILEHPHMEAYQFIITNLEKRIPKLSGSPNQEEERIADILLKQEDRLKQVLNELEKEVPHWSDQPEEKKLSQLREHILHITRHDNAIQLAKKCYESIPETTETDGSHQQLDKAIQHIKFDEDF